ncbi:LysE family translocator [Thioclava sp. GXIMD4215]|uniref:LysE family translocator n=1 Tax=Thioclava sp. GXIMD4215 TaxID=3131928 RepID=UPI003252BE9E
MFEYSLLHWLTFLSAAVVLNVSPGPDMAFILGQTLSRGKRAGLAALAGVWCGALVHICAAATGLSALLAGSAVAFSVVKWIGAAYLFYLGLMAFRTKAGVLQITPVRPASFGRTLRQGLMVSVLNPKVALFFLAFLPQFVVDGAGPVWAQLALHGGLIIVVAALFELPLVFIADRLCAGLRRAPRLGKIFDRMFGSILIVLGVRLVVSQR